MTGLGLNTGACMYWKGSTLYIHLYTFFVALFAAMPMGRIFYLKEICINSMNLNYYINLIHM